MAKATDKLVDESHSKGFENIEQIIGNDIQDYGQISKLEVSKHLSDVKFNDKLAANIILFFPRRGMECTLNPHLKISDLSKLVLTYLPQYMFDPYKPDVKMLGTKCKDIVSTA